MSRKQYRHLGYYSDLNDVLRLHDKKAEDIVDEYLKDNGCFHETSDDEIDEYFLDREGPTFVNKNGKIYAVIIDSEWSSTDLLELDPDCINDEVMYEMNSIYIDIYELITE